MCPISTCLRLPSSVNSLLFNLSFTSTTYIQNVCVWVTVCVWLVTQWHRDCLMLEPQNLVPRLQPYPVFPWQLKFAHSPWEPQLDLSPKAEAKRDEKKPKQNPKLFGEESCTYSYCLITMLLMTETITSRLMRIFSMTVLLDEASTGWLWWLDFWSTDSMWILQGQRALSEDVQSSYKMLLSEGTRNIFFARLPWQQERAWKKGFWLKNNPALHFQVSYQEKCQQTLSICIEMVKWNKTFIQLKEKAQNVFSLDTVKLWISRYLLFIYCTVCIFCLAKAWLTIIKLWSTVLFEWLAPYHVGHFHRGFFETQHPFSL